MTRHFLSSAPKLSSGSGLSSDSSDPEEEDDWVAVEDFSDGDESEHAQTNTGGQYATACDQVAEEMRDAASARPPRMFVPVEESFYIKRLVKTKTF